MGRPSKNGRFVNFLIPITLLDKVEKVASIMGVTKTALLENALQNYVEPFHNSDGEISPANAVYVKTKEPCVVLDAIIIGSDKYYKIYCNKEILTVPIHDVVMDSH